MRRTARKWCASLVGLLLSVPLGASGQAPATYPIGRDLPVFRVPDTDANAPVAEPAEPGGVLTLDSALAAALLRNPELAAGAYEVRAQEAAVLQAGAHPNPTVSLETEDVLGSGDYRGFDSAQTTLLVGQLIELGGKRAARIALASADRDLASWDYEVRRIDVLSRTAGAFVDVLAAQERHRLAEEGLEVARSMQHVASRRARSGIATQAEEIRASVAVDVAGVELEHTEHGLATARQRLAAFWAGRTARFERASGDLDRLPVTPTEEDLERRLDESPSVARWQAELARRDAARERVRSERIPDVTLHAGPRYLSDPDKAVLVVGVSVPLPLWNRREAALAEANYRVAKLAAESRAEQVRTAADLAAARVGLEASSEEAHLLRTRVLPGADRAVEALKGGYQQGRFAQAEVLDAVRARLAAREQYLEAVTEAHHSAQQIERLTGVPLEVRP